MVSYFKNLFDRYRNIINSPTAYSVNSIISCEFIYLKWFDSIERKLRPIIFIDLYAVANPNIVKTVDNSTVIPKDFILMASASNIPITGSSGNCKTYGIRR